MIAILRTPQLSTGSDVSTLVEWSVPAKQPFEAGACLGLLETDKAMVELPADEPGVILLTLAEPGSGVRTGEPIAVVGTVADLDRSPADILAAVGLSVAAPEVVPETVVPETVVPETVVPEVVVPARETGPARVFASPLARRIAAEAQLDIADIAGSGPGGRIVRRDVEAATRDRAAVEPDRSDAPGPRATVAGVATEPHSRFRRLMATRLTESKQTVPHFYLRGRARVEALLDAREQLNAGRAADAKITINDLIVKATGRAHTLVPALNRIWTDDAVLAFERVDVAVAMATTAGVVTPVVRDVDRCSIEQIATTSRSLRSAAQESRLRQSDLEGATITVSNLGMFAVEEFTAIINPPHSAILAVGGVRDEPVVAGSAVVPAKVMRFVLSVDHRPVDGADAAQWMREFVSLIECPIRMLA